MANPPLVTGFRNPEIFPPFGKAFGFISNFYYRIRSSIPGLLIRGGPLAVIFRIPFFIIFALQCSSSGTLPHVSEEIHKPFKPFGTYGNPSTPVSVVIFIFGYTASSDHRAPRSIRSDSFDWNTKFGLFGSVETSTRFRITSPDIETVDYFLFSAITTKVPVRDLANGVRVIQRNKSSESVAGNVLEIVSPFADVRSRFIHANFMSGFSASRLLNTAASHDYHTMEKV